MLFPISRKGRWQAKFKKAHPYASQKRPETEKLRLILGTARSGTSWISQVLFEATLPGRYLSEPLFHIHPRLPFHKTGDHSAVNYEDMPDDHPLFQFYRLLVQRDFDPSVLPVLWRNDPDWQVCLVKEVHALLGAEGLLRKWQPPTLLIMRDPVYVVDSLFAAQTLETHHGVSELISQGQPAFLERFVSNRRRVIEGVIADTARRDDRLRVVLGKVIYVQLIQEMFAVLGGEFPCARAVRYEDFCENPGQSFRSLAGFFGIPWDNKIETYLAQTMRADDTSGDPYSVKRNTAAQKTRPHKFLTAEEVKLGREIVAAIQNG